MRGRIGVIFLFALTFLWSGAVWSPDVICADADTETVGEIRAARVKEEETRSDPETETQARAGETESELTESFGDLDGRLLQRLLGALAEEVFLDPEAAGRIADLDLDKLGEDAEAILELLSDETLQRFFSYDEVKELADLAVTGLVQMAQEEPELLVKILRALTEEDPANE